jgi:hypothetical protein
MDDGTIAILVPTLSWSLREREDVNPQPVEPRRTVAVESMRWQQLSAQAASAELVAYPMPFRRVERWNDLEHVIEARAGVPPREQNRILEIHGLMGAIGEQLGMAWTAEQDAQRLVLTSDHRDELTNRLMLRAQSELVGHFLLGATHSLANLVLRVLLLNVHASDSLIKAYKVQRFPPGSDERDVWPTYGPTMAQRLRGAARASLNPGLQRLADAVSVLRLAPAYKALDGRRGMDYHRRRPQSVAHTAPRAGTVSTANGVTTLKMVAPQLDPDASAEVVHSVVATALEAVATSMREIRRAIPDAVRGEQVNYPYDFVPEAKS